MGVPWDVHGRSFESYKGFDGNNQWTGFNRIVFSDLRPRGLVLAHLSGLNPCGQHYSLHHHYKK